MKKAILFFLTVTFAGILSIGCSNNIDPSKTVTAKDSSASFDAMSMKKTIEEKNAEFAKAFITGDSATMVNHYTQDGKIFPPNSVAAVGSPAIAALISEYLKFGIKEFHDETTALYGNNDNLIEEGTYFMGDGKGKTIDKGKYICIWRKIDGQWKAYSDIFNTSLPEAQAK